MPDIRAKLIWFRFISSLVCAGENEFGTVSENFSCMKRILLQSEILTNWFRFQNRSYFSAVKSQYSPGQRRMLLRKHEKELRKRMSQLPVSKLELKLLRLRFHFNCSPEWKQLFYCDQTNGHKWNQNQLGAIWMQELPENERPASQFSLFSGD